MYVIKKYFQYKYVQQTVPQTVCRRYFSSVVRCTISGTLADGSITTHFFLFNTLSEDLCVMK